MERLSESAALLESGNADASDAASSLEASPSRSNFLYTVGKATVASFAVAGVMLLGTVGSHKKPPSSRTSSLAESHSLAEASSFSLAGSSTTLSVTLQPFNDDFHYGRMQQTIASYPSMGLSNLVEPMKPTTFGVAFDDVTIGEKVQKGELVCSYSVQSMLLGSDTVTPWDSGNTVPQSSYIETGELGAITLPDGENRDMATVGLSASFPSPPPPPSLRLRAASSWRFFRFASWCALASRFRLKAPASNAASRSSAVTGTKSSSAEYRA